MPVYLRVSNLDMDDFQVLSKGLDNEGNVYYQRAYLP